MSLLMCLLTCNWCRQRRLPLAAFVVLRSCGTHFGQRTCSTRSLLLVCPPRTAFVSLCYCCYCTTLSGDFFSYKDPSGLFDFGYDYTFL